MCFALFWRLSHVINADEQYLQVHDLLGHVITSPAIFSAALLTSDMATDIEVHMVADMKVDVGAYKVADMVAYMA